MLIYRVENSKRQGPYHSSQNVLAEHSIRNKSEPRHPSPKHDQGLCSNLVELFGEGGAEDFPMKYRFGFSSIEQAKKWICKKSWAKSLRKNGFSISVFEVPDEFCIKGTHQVMYESKRVKTSTKRKQCILEVLWTKKK